MIDGTSWASSPRRTVLWPRASPGREEEMRRVYLALLALGLLSSIAACDSKDSESTTIEKSDSERSESAIPTRPEKADPDDWCGGHGLPESMCTKCNPELTEKFKEAGDWCAPHELPESVCPKCNPMHPPNRDGHIGQADDWCGGHGLPESMCTKCNPELTEKFKEAGDWCAPHGFPESVCPGCNPMTPPGEDAHQPRPGHGSGALDWCAGHGLPESKCTKCNPELTATFKKTGDWCAEHEYPESVCPKCNPQTPPTGFVKPPFKEGTLIRLKSGDHEKTTGAKTVKAQRVELGLTIEAPARVEFDQNRVATVRAPVPGIVTRVLVDLGEEVFHPRLRRVF